MYMCASYNKADAYNLLQRLQRVKGEGKKRQIRFVDIKSQVCVMTSQLRQC